MQKRNLMAGDSSVMEKSAHSLMKDSLWKKKTITEKDEKTGEETTKEDYDWNAITKAVKSYINDYNSVVEAAGESNAREVLRNAVRMTKTTAVNAGLLSDVGITVGKDNKLELDDEKLKKADISTLKTLFTGHNSYASKMQYRANAIMNAVFSAGGTYTKQASFLQQIENITHEMYHAYQSLEIERYESVRSQDEKGRLKKEDGSYLYGEERKNTVRVWQKEFEEYEGGADAADSESTLLRYYYQTVEVSARSYSERRTEEYRRFMEKS